MEMPGVGGRCTFPSCSALDFLPVTCGLCRQQFCSEHSVPSVHGCADAALGVVVSDEEARRRRPSTWTQCALDTCKARDPQTVTCKFCDKTFCISHRHPSEHQCPSLTVAQARAAEDQEHARQVEASHEAAKHTLAEKQAKKRLGRKAQATRDKVMLMRIKGKAVGSASLPPEKRLYLGLVLAPLDPKKGTKCLSTFFNKTWTIGKIVDEAARLLKVHNSNAVAGAPQLRLFLQAGDRLTALDSATPAGEVEGLRSGSVAVLTKREELGPDQTFAFKP